MTARITCRCLRESHWHITYDSPGPDRHCWTTSKPGPRLHLSCHPSSTHRARSEGSVSTHLHDNPPPPPSRRAGGYFTLVLFLFCTVQYIHTYIPVVVYLSKALSPTRKILTRSRPPPRVRWPPLGVTVYQCSSAESKARPGDDQTLVVTPRLHIKTPPR